jgi:hypothetical protein
MNSSKSTASSQALQPAHQSNTVASNHPEVPDFAEGTEPRPTPGGRLRLEFRRGRTRLGLDAAGGQAFATVIALGVLVTLVVALSRFLP